MDEVPLRGTHHVELWVGNAKQAAYYYRKAFGFSQIAYSGLETGNRENTSYVLEQGKIKLVLTTPLSSNNRITNHLRKHGDGVRDIAFHVDDVESCFKTVVENGAEPLAGPHELVDEHGIVAKATIKTYGDVVHSFICDENYDGVFIPGFREDSETEYSFGFKFIDHIVGNVEKGQMNHWADFYADVFSFTQLVHFTDKDISTKYSALMSKVMQNSNRYIKFPINEPADGLNKSQIQEFLDYYGGPGSQHIALLTDDIVHTCTQMRNAGVEFLEIPDAYYDVLKERVGDIEEDIEILRQLGILVDRAGEGYLLQLFTKPVQDRPTLFYEIIQRKGSDGFGQGNFQALFDSIEHEQGLRGNL